MLAPTNLERLDDQIARATYAGEKGWADILFPNRPEDHGQIIADFMYRLRKGARVENRPDSFADQAEMSDALDRIRNVYLA